MSFDFDSDELVRGEGDFQKGLNWKILSAIAVGGATGLYLLSRLLEYAMFSGEFWERWSL